jgi:hypothetical protein
LKGNKINLMIYFIFNLLVSLRWWKNLIEKYGQRDLNSHGYLPCIPKIQMSTNFIMPVLRHRKMVSRLSSANIDLINNNLKITPKGLFLDPLPTMWGRGLKITPSPSLKGEGVKLIRRKWLITLISAEILIFYDNFTPIPK